MVLHMGVTTEEESTTLESVEEWPQAPLLLRPTPGSQTVIRGIRFADSIAYLDPVGDSSGPIRGALPINTGHEKRGKSMVIDFETPLFVGSFLIRIQGLSPFNPTSKTGLVATEPIIIL